MENIKSNLVNFGRKFVIAFVVISIAGLGLLIKPTASYAGVLFNDGTVNGDPWHKYEDIDPQVRAEAIAHEVPTSGSHEFGRTDETRYKEDSTHWVQNLRFKVDKNIAGKRGICVVTKDTDSGWWILDAIDWKYHVVVESTSGVEATFWINDETCADHLPDIKTFIEPSDCESGNKDIMNEILENPHMADCNGIKMYIDKVWIQD